MPTLLKPGIIKGMRFKKFTSIPFLLLSFSANAWAAGSEVKINVTLNPAGSFVAHTTAIKGSTKKVGETYTATNIVLNLNDLRTGISLRDQHMKQKYFETSKYPQATLKQATAKDGKFTGKLVIRNVEKDILGEYEVEGGQFIAKFKTNLSDFKIQSANYMGVGAEDEVEVEVSLPAKPMTAL